LETADWEPWAVAGRRALNFEKRMRVSAIHREEESEEEEESDWLKLRTGNREPRTL